MEWLIDNLGTILVALAVAAVVALIIIRRVKNRKQGRSTCGCGCADCPMKNKCH